MARPRKGKTGDLPGTEPITISEVSAALAEYKETSDERIELLSKEIKLKDKLMSLMKDHGLVTYRDDDLVCTYASKAKESIKVKRVKADLPEDDDD
jgi:hypothetical protein